jgi:hypothetical protein
VGELFGAGEVVDVDDLDVVTPMCDTQYTTSDPAKSINCNA